MRSKVALLAALVTALMAAGCGEPAESGDEPAADALPGVDTLPGVDPLPEAEPGADTLPGADPLPEAEPGGAEVLVWFARGEAPVAVERQVPGADPAAALQALLAGPTAAEREGGITSWFSAETAGALAGVERREGFLIVDFSGLDRLIPNASSSAGSAALLGSLDSTVFQFAGVDSVEYRLDGSCAAFWQWLQRDCTVVRRPVSRP